MNYRSSLRNKLVAEGFYLVNAIEKYLLTLHQFHDCSSAAGPR
jgi:hypothetical protein